ncbi:MAG TPA: hypothetical protein VFP36_07470 [Usitatibacter sp.]|nr:hypothetical protein [Usitatibacter sp.]
MKKILAVLTLALASLICTSGAIAATPEHGGNAKLIGKDLADLYVSN